MSNVTEFELPARRRRHDGGADPCCAVRRHVAWLLAGIVGFAGVTQATGKSVCRPALSVTKVQFSRMQPPTLERRWTAIVVADASRCATTAGYFAVGFSRMKEYGPEIEFREEFIWSAPSVPISVDFAADEAVESYWIDSVQACPCAK